MEKNITKELDIRYVTSTLKYQIENFGYILTGAVPASEEAKEAIRTSIKDSCDTIVKWVEQF